MVQLHCSAFPQYLYVADSIERDAGVDPNRGDLIVHQYLLVIEGVPVGFIRGSSNLLRRTAVIEFLAVEPTTRKVRIEGLRVSDWLMRNCQRQYRVDTGQECLGCTGEVAHNLLKPFLEYGWHVLPCDYTEPVHGWHWAERGLDRFVDAMLGAEAPTRSRSAQDEGEEEPSSEVATDPEGNEVDTESAEQSEGRIYRINTDHPVDIRYVVGHGLDRELFDRVQRKREIAAIIQKYRREYHDAESARRLRARQRRRRRRRGLACACRRTPRRSAGAAGGGRTRASARGRCPSPGRTRCADAHDPARRGTGSATGRCAPRLRGSARPRSSRGTGAGSARGRWRTRDRSC